MYWFRDGNPLQLLPWLIISLIWFIGGWLIASHAFRLDKRERLIVGIGIGLCSYLWFVNMLGRWLIPDLAFTVASIIVFIIGAAFALRGKKPLLNWGDFQAWRLLLIGLILTFIFTQIGKGLGLFDDHKNLSIISTMAAGDIPPHFYMNPSFYFSYHYGFQIIGSSLMRLGGLYPWSAFDFSKALLGAYVILLSYLLGRRYLESKIGGAVVAFVLTFATGTRYLLLLIPPAVLLSLSPSISLINTSSEMGVPFYLALTKRWVVDGGPPSPFIFGFMNGISSWPHFMAIQAGPSSLSLVVLLLIWLLASRSLKNSSFLVFVFLFALWGLAFESSYALFIAGSGLVALYYIWNRVAKKLLRPEYYGLVLSIPIVFFQGGSLTEMLRKQLWGSVKSINTIEAGSFAGFSLRWPPAIVSAHLSPLRITSPAELLIAIFEIGPIIFLTPWITIWCWRRFKKGEWILGALILSSWVGFLAPIFLRFQSDRDITRLSAYSIMLWTIMLVLLIWEYSGKWEPIVKQLGAVALILMVFGGFVISGISLTAASEPMISSGITNVDVLVAQETWDKLDINSLIFDPERWRATALTGRLTSSGINVHKNLPEWEELRVAPTLEGMLEEGFAYIYVDEEWWKSLSEESKNSLTNPCVRIVSEQWDINHNKFRRLIDITGCLP